jgi:hypothetical protein
MTLFFVAILGVCAAVAALVVVFSPSKSYLCVTSVIMTLLLLALGAFLESGRSIFWIAPSFLLLDMAMIYFVFATGLRAGAQRELRPRTKVFISLCLSLAISLVACAIYLVWSSGFSPEIHAGEAKTPFNQMFWGPNQALVFFCFLILAPISVGSLLMVRRKD